mgnify:CR=1 FL=1|tara:strand:- start:469 stop:693 length:225 start_codon:yes stop_codon:yes gene_type:complete
MKVGDIVEIQSFPDHGNPCPHSGCPTWRSAIGILVEKLYEYDGSQTRVVVLVEGKDHYFFNYNVKLLEVENESR